MSPSTKNSKLRQPLWQQFLPAFVAFAATLIAAPGHAVTIPNLPLQTGSAYPPPNIMLILDDSGSMTWRYMYNTNVVSISGGGITSGPTGDNKTSDSDYGTNSTNANAIYDQSYVTNTIYYNAAITYRAWIKADGNREAGGMAYTSAYGNANALTGLTDLSDDTQTHYVPKPGATALNATSSYYRYQIVSGGGDVVRSEYGAVTTTVTGFPTSGQNGSSGVMGGSFTITVPANTPQLVITSSGGSHGTNGGANNDNGDGADLYVRLGSAPTTGAYDCRKQSGGNNQTCTIDNPQAGVWYVALYGASNYKAVAIDASMSNRCGTASGSSDWINCTSITPTGRTLPDELTNFATWYSYHRTRIKVAKAGGSEAFSQLGSNVRVGYDSIWNRNPYPIPVGSANGGVFTGTNRSEWFTHLHAAAGNNGTPLKGALQRTGKYFESSVPWGPETGANQISCRQNFAILTTDGYWNNNSGYTSPVGDADGTTGTKITSKDGKTDFTYAPERPYSDNFSTSPSTQPNTLADVAMDYWKRDLRTAMDNDVPSSVADPAFWQHMVTFGVSIGLQGLLNPAADLPSIINGSKYWGDPVSPDTEGPKRIDDLWHAAVNGRGNFVSASNSQQFAQGLSDALATVAARLGSASNVTANSTSFQSDTRIYQASYVSGKWTGELAAYEVSAAGISTVDANGDGNPDAVWQASKKIPATGRTILTWNVSSAATFPTEAQTIALDQSSRALSPVAGPDNAAYLAGATTLERRNGGNLRDRDTLLGDIANSSPMYVKESQTIFVGANDGMLHAFNALTGVERFAYVPHGINLPDLATLSDPKYIHRYFVDGSVAVSTTKQTPGKNYLVGALGRGGKGVFGLDVTAPGTFGTGNVLWDNTGSTAPANMGHVLGDPLVVSLNDGSKGVIVSNGVNSTTGTASLFVINISTGVVIKELNTLAIGDNGLSAPRGADLDGNGTVDYVYAGDLKGNLWKFDLNGTAASSWVIANGGSPMFVATDSAGKRQPITSGVALARNPSTSKVWVFIGTGSFMTVADVANNDVQSLYGVIDDNAVVAGRGALAERQILVTTTVGGRSVRGFEPHEDVLVSGKKGWFIDLDDPEAGERIVSPPRVIGSVLLTASLIPPSIGTCDAGGTGYINAIDVFTGTSLGEPYFDTNGDGKFDGNDEVAAGGEKVPVGSIGTGSMPTLPVLIGKRLFWGESDGGKEDEAVNPQGGLARRISWREVVGE